MHHYHPYFDLHHSPLLGRMSVLCLLLALGFVAGWYFRRWKRLSAHSIARRSCCTPQYAAPVDSSPVSSTPVSPAQPLSLVRELSWFAAPACVLATFAGITATGVSTPVHDAIRVPEGAALNVSVIKNASLTAERPVPIGSKKKRPAWTQAPISGDQLSQRVVLTSQRYSSPQEAENDLWVQATQLLAKDLSQVRPEAQQPTTWRPTLDQIRGHMVRQQHTEVSDHDFGSFVHPMYQAWWQVELSPAVRTEFLPAWRHNATVGRIRTVGVVAGSIALVISVLAAYRRTNILTHGQWQTPLRLVAGGAMLAWLVALKAAFQHLETWHL